jgi:hypothetical protein
VRQDHPVPKRRNIDWAGVDTLLGTHERVVTHEMLKSIGMAPSTITARLVTRGPWQRLLPGVVLAHRGMPTHRERQLGALAFAGSDAVISGSTALIAHRVKAAPAARSVFILVPVARQRRSYDRIQVERTRRLPTPVFIKGLPYAPVPRAVVDACRQLEAQDQVRELVAEVIQRRLCSLEELSAEIRAAARQRTGVARHVLREMSAGVRSVAEARARDCLQRHGIPQPLWNVDLTTEDGEFIARPDGYWEDVAAALEIDSMAWHLRPSAYLNTQRRQRDLTRRGILVLPVAPQLILEDEYAFTRDVLAHLAEARRREPPSGIRVRRSAAA